MRCLPDVLDHVDDVEYHRDVHPVGGGARFHQVELRLGAIDERDPALDVLRVLAARLRSVASATTSHGSRSRLAQTRFATGRGRTARALAPGGRGIKLCRNSSGLRTNGAVV